MSEGIYIIDLHKKIDNKTGAKKSFIEIKLNREVGRSQRGPATVKWELSIGATVKF